MESNRQWLRATLEQKRLLGREIAAARVRLGMEQADLGAKLGRSQEWVSRLEKGESVLSVFEYFRLAGVVGLEHGVVAAIAERLD